MNSNDSGQDDDKQLLERYRRASDAEPAVPSEAVRAAILAEGRRVAGQIAQQGSQPRFDTSRPAANDSRWKVPAFGTLGAALLAALLIAPRYWQTLPASKGAAAQLRAPAAAPAPAPPPKLESAAPIAPSESLQEVIVAPAIRGRVNPQANAPVAVPVPQNYAAPPAAADAAPEARAPLTAAARSADGAIYNSADRLSGGRPAPTPARLQSAAQAGDLAQASALLDQGAAMEARDAQGRTPLMLAVAQGRLEVVRLLLQRGADPNAADNSGKTPLRFATDQNFKDIAALLRGAGAQ